MRGEPFGGGEKGGPRYDKVDKFGLSGLDVMA